MNSRRPLIVLPELLELIIDHRGKTPKKLGGDFSSKGILVLSGKHIKTGKLVNRNQLRYVSEEMYPRWMKVEMKQDDIVMTSEAPLGEVYVLPDDTKYVLGQRLFGLRANPKKIDPHYLAAWLTSSLGRAALQARASGSTVLGIKQSQLVKILVDVPEMATQRVIGSLRKAINHKVTINHQINKTLESIAQTIFKSWFVDFDPVKAKMEGREPEGMAAETAALFPSKLVESELGAIPEGWKPGIVGDVLSLKYGKALKKNDRIDGHYPVYGSGGIVGSHNELLVGGPGIVVGRKGSVGTVYWSDESFYPIDTVFYVDPKEDCPMQYLYFLLIELDLQRLSADSAVPGINRNSIHSQSIVTPTSKILNSFSYLVKSVFDKIANSKRQNETLSRLRDTLLPKLISGEIQIPEE
jgi:type I restriction enzyme, S subunit